MEKISAPGEETDEFFNMDGDLDSEIEFRNANIMNNEDEIINEISGLPANEDIVQKLRDEGCDIESVVNELVKKKLDKHLEEMRKEQDSESSSMDFRNQVGSSQNGDKVEQIEKGINYEIPWGSNGDNDMVTPVRRIVKSPSDTTLYAPLLKKKDGNSNSSNIIDKISNFVESIRMSQEEGNPNQRRKSVAEAERERKLQEITPVARQEKFTRERETDDGNKKEQEVTAGTVANRFIVEAEKFRANISTPQGRSPQFNQIEDVKQ